MSTDQVGKTETKQDAFSEKFHSFAENSQLTITTAAFGLGKNEDANLVSYDDASWRESLKEAFMSMQKEDTGKVVSVELVPWAENTDFQEHVELETTDLEDEEGAVEKKEGDEAKLEKSAKPAKKLLLYEKKQNITRNSEFLAEIEKVDRNLLNIFYKAQLCRKNIDGQWKEYEKDQSGAPKIGGKLVWKSTVWNGKRRIMNNRSGEDFIPIRYLDETLTPDYIEGLYQNQVQFMYGKGGSADKPTKDGAAACMRELLRGDGGKAIFSTSYRFIPACKALEKQMMHLENPVVEDFCMPRLEGSVTTLEDLEKAERNKNKASFEVC